VGEGIFQIPFQLSPEAVGVGPMLRKYQDRAIELAGACLIHLANEFETGDILTLDRDFEIYRWGRNKGFRLLPERTQVLAIWKSYYFRQTTGVANPLAISGSGQDLRR
jgi:hypothetical protein